MIYNYKALDKNGKTKMGIVEASSLSGAKVLLKNQGLYISAISEEKKKSKATTSHSDKQEETKTARWHNLLHRISARDRAIFSRQLGTLLKAGMELVTSLGDIADQTENEYFRKIIWDIKDSVQEGAALSRALTRYPQIFSNLYIYMIQAGENLGRVDDIMLRLAELEEKGNRIRNKIQGAMLYPAFMVVMMILVISLLMSKVVPEITKVFTRSQATLPLPTQMIINFSEFFSQYWPIVFGLIGLLIYGFYRYIHTLEGRKKWDIFKLQNKITRTMYAKIVTTRFARNLGLLLRSNVDLLDSLRIVKKIVQNVHVEKAIEEVAEEIQSGGSLARSLKNKNIFPKMVTGMVAAGEASDKLDDMLIKIAEIYEEEVETNIQAFLSLLEPLIIVIMAISVGFVVLSIILPITQMNQLIK